MKTSFVLTDLEKIRSSCERIMQASQQSARLPGNQEDLVQLPLCFYPVSCPTTTSRRLRSNKHQGGFFKDGEREFIGRVTWPVMQWTIKKTTLILIFCSKLHRHTTVNAT